MKAIIFYLVLLVGCFFEIQSFGMNQSSELTNEKSKNKNLSKSDKIYQCNDCEVSLTRKYNYRTHMMRLHAFCTWCKSYPIGKQEAKWYISVSEQERKNVYNHLIECVRQFGKALYGCSMCFGVNCTMNSIHFVKDCSGKIKKFLSNKKLASNKKFQNCYGVLKKNSSGIESDYKNSEDTNKNIDSSNLVMTSHDQLSLENFLEIINDDSVGQKLYDLVNTDFICTPILNTDYEINDITNEELNSAEIAIKNVCYQCPEPKKLARSEYYKNHMISQHGICPWCCVQFPNDGKRLKKLSLQDPKKAAAHLIVCAEKNNTSLYVCNICFGTQVNKNSVHIKKSCKGVISKQSKAIDKTELSELSEELVLLSKDVDQQDQSTLITLQDEHDSSQQKEIYLSDDFFTETNLSTPSNSSNLAIVYEDQIMPNNRSHEFWCEKCNMEFKVTENRIKHILSIHYACPWCNHLEYLKKDTFRSMSPEEKEVRVEHIKKCAEQHKRSSLWKCQKCSALFNYANNDHSCGRDYQLNLMVNKIQNAELGLKISEKNICYKCPEPKKFARTRSCINHIIRKHASCPGCSSSFANKAKPFKDLILIERKLAIDHLIQCTQGKNIFSCNTCFGVKVGDRAVHIKKSCTGSVCKKTYTA